MMVIIIIIIIIIVIITVVVVVVVKYLHCSLSCTQLLTLHKSIDPAVMTLTVRRMPEQAIPVKECSIATQTMPEQTALAPSTSADPGVSLLQHTDPACLSVCLFVSLLNAGFVQSP